MRKTDIASGFDPGRRAALVKLGRFAAYTAPALSTLLIGSDATAGHNPPDKCPPTGTPPNPIYQINHCTPVDPCEVNPNLPECGSAAGAAASEFSGENLLESDPAAIDQAPTD